MATVVALLLPSGAMAQSAAPVQRARAFAVAAHYDSAIALYDSVLAAAPRDFDAARGRAQTIAWSGRLDVAEATYRALIDSGAGLDATKGLARVLGWRGRLAESEGLYRGVAAHDSTDSEALTGLAQILEWERRPRAARVALVRAIAAHPDDGDARAAMARLRPIIAPSLGPAVTTAGDNEHNTSIAGTFGADALAPWNGRVAMTATYRDARGLGAHGRSIVAGLGTRWDGAIGVRVDAGIADTHGTAPGIAARSVATVAGSAHATATLGPLTMTAGAWRAPFDETATLIAHGIVQQAVDGSAEVRLPAGAHGEWQGAYATLSGGSLTNRRVEGSAYLWTGVWHGIALGAGSRGYGYLRPDDRDGYFAPASFILGEGVVRAATARERGINASAEVGAGAQRISAFAQPMSVKPAERISGSLTYRVAPGIEWGIRGGYAVAASPYATSAGAAAGYRGYSLGATARFIP